MQNLKRQRGGPQPTERGILYHSVELLFITLFHENEVGTLSAYIPDAVNGFKATK